MHALAGDLREKFRIRGPDAEEVFILHRHASRNQTLGMVGRELLVEVSIPAQLRQVHSGVLIESFMAFSLHPSPPGSKNSCSFPAIEFQQPSQALTGADLPSRFTNSVRRGRK